MRVVLVATAFLAVLPLAAEESHWAYRAPAAARVAESGLHPVDAILANAWNEAGLEAAGMAAPRRWVERAAFTLTGLPPDEALVKRIESAPDEATWAAVIDELLASPAYGERWARHWMDVARYADTQGYNFDQDNRYPFAYTYRDWLIRAFNDDLPYARFVQLQLAADLLVDRPDHPDLAALGFLTVGPRAGGPETIDDRVDVITRGFLSSTVACARCHEHKTDPITMEDYYSIYSILENTIEAEDKPVIGEPADRAAHQAYLAEEARLLSEDRAVRQGIVDQLRAPASMAVYLDLAWSAHAGDWDARVAVSESFKRGRYRPTAVLRWRDFLRKSALGEQADGRLAGWVAAMRAAGSDAAARMAACEALARDWAGAPEGSPLRALALRGDCPLSHDVDRVREVMDVEDGNAARARRAAMARLQVEHPGSPPRAMSVCDRPDPQPARTYKRGNPAAPGEPFERQWLEFLGGGAYPAGKPPRLALAEKITDPANPLTARVIVNRVWAWHFGAPLADPGDFGPQESAPVLLPLLDELALRFQRSGGSLKQLHRLLLTSKAFRLAADGPSASLAADPANTRFWRWQRRRLDFETMRDRVLFSAGALDLRVKGGRSVLLEDAAADRRRSVYAFVDRYAMPTTLVSFDLPHPDHHSPKRVETTVPQQALWFLNGPLVIRRAAAMLEDPEFKALKDDAAKLGWMFQKVYRRNPRADEMDAVLKWIAGRDAASYQPRLGGVWEVRHARDDGGVMRDVVPFPVFRDGVWKTGDDIAQAPIRWLHAGATGGHAAAGHGLVLRWRARTAGEARMVGSIRRTQDGGAALAWGVTSAEKPAALDRRLEPRGHAVVEGAWQAVAAGSTLDFVLRAPEGDSFGGVAWDLRIEGREGGEGAAVVEVGRLQDEFPNTTAAPAPSGPGDPWADLVQMLWASNEFHFID